MQELREVRKVSALGGVGGGGDWLDAELSMQMFESIHQIR